MSTDQQAAACPVVHYDLPAQCTLLADHDDTWHRTAHPDTGRQLRFRQVDAVQQTQEWEPDDDPVEPDAGRWFTWHYSIGPTSTVVVSDLDERAASLVSGHFPTGRTRPGPDGRGEEECACGQHYRAGRPDIHLGRQVSLLARSFFDLALEYGHHREGRAR